MRIIITEQQLDIIKTLVESEAPLLNNGDTKEYGDTSEISTSATITDADGNPKPGKDVYADEVSKFQANQDWRGCLRQRIG
jgi:hypothetical protein